MADQTETPSQQQLRRTRIVKKTFVIIKITIFLLVWLYSAIYMIITPTHQPHVVIVPLAPRNPFLASMGDMPQGNQITVELTGAIDEDATNTPKGGSDDQPFILVMVAESANESTCISQGWLVFLQRPAAGSSDTTVKKYLDVRCVNLEFNRDMWLRSGSGSESESRSGSGSDNNELHVSLTNFGNDSLAIMVTIDSNPIHLETSIVCGICLLLFLYVLIIWDITDRTFAAILVATTSIGVLCMLGERPELDEIIEWIDMETLMLLFSMMVMVFILVETGIFDVFSLYAYKFSKGNIWLLIFYMCMFTGLLSAFLDNVTIVLLMVPVTMRLCETLSLSTTIVLISIAIFANIGGTLTPVGDPPNVIVATDPYSQQHDILFGNFFLHMLPGVFLCMLISFGMFYLMVRNKLFVNLDPLNPNLPATPKQPAGQESFTERLDAMRLHSKIKNMPLLISCCVTFVIAILFFFLNSLPALPGLSLCWGAMLAAILLLILANPSDIDPIIHAVEWSTLLFFAALFVLMEAIVKMGVINWVGELTRGVVNSVGRDHQLLVSIVLITWICAFASAFIDNIPVTTMMLKLVIKMAKDPQMHLPFTPLIWSLLYGACFGGNGSLIGASANVVTAGIASQHGYRITFRSFFFIGFPIMLVTVLVATIYLMIAHCVCSWHEDHATHNK